MRNRKHDGNKSSVVNFGVQGWVTILYCLLMFWLYAGMVNSGSNVTAPAIAEKFGILPGTVLNMNTVAGVVGVIFFIVVGQINRVIGARITSGVCLIVAGLAYLGVGNAVNLAMYTVCGLHLRRGSGHPVVPQEKRHRHGLHHHGPQSGLRRLCPPYHTSGRSAGHWQRCNSHLRLRHRAGHLWSASRPQYSAGARPQPGQCVR